MLKARLEEPFLGLPNLFLLRGRLRIFCITTRVVGFARALGAVDSVPSFFHLSRGLAFSAGQGDVADGWWWIAERVSSRGQGDVLISHAASGRWKWCCAQVDGFAFSVGHCEKKRRRGLGSGDIEEEISGVIGVCEAIRLLVGFLAVDEEDGVLGKGLQI